MPAVLALAMMLQAAASAEAPPPRLPADFQIRTFWPTTAHRAGIEGATVVRCKIRPDGVAHDCQVVRETPVGYRFGVAAVKAFEGRRLEPGAPGAGYPAEADLKLNFTLSGYRPYIRVQTHDGWTTIQQHERWRDFYPGKALGDGVAGEADVRCTAAEGKVGCVILREEPAGHGFGDAALKLQARMFLQPPPGGAKSTGNSVRYTVYFNP